MNFIDAMTAVTLESTVRRTELEPTSHVNAAAGGSTGGRLAGT
jgi:hypothetical protein